MPKGTSPQRKSLEQTSNWYLHYQEIELLVKQNLRNIILRQDQMGTPTQP